MRKIWLAVALLLMAVLLPGAEKSMNEEPPPPPPPRGERPGGPAMWRAFSALDEKERGELIVLQRTDPEAFREKMKALTEAFRKRERERIAELKKLVTEYRSIPTETERRNELRTEISRRIREDYQKRLSENRRQLEEMKKRVTEMERELDKREEKADIIIKARIEALLSGAEEVDPPRRRKAPPPPPEDRP